MTPGDGEPHREPPPAGGRVSLFVTCVVDQFVPEVGIASVALLEAAGYEVDFPQCQGCCGQPAYSAGHPEEAKRLAVSTIECLSSSDAIVVPSGSCAAMLRHAYPRLLDSPPWDARAAAVAERTWELTELLALRPPVFGGARTPRAAEVDVKVTIHDSCHGLRELGLGRQARGLLEAAGYAINESADPEVCCGFGGVFTALQPEIACAMADDKLDMCSSAAGTAVGGDSACLLHLEGRLLKRDNAPPLALRHIAEALADALPAGREGAGG